MICYNKLAMCVFFSVHECVAVHCALMCALMCALSVKKILQKIAFISKALFLAGIIMTFYLPLFTEH